MACNCTGECFRGGGCASGRWGAAPIRYYTMPPCEHCHCQPGDAVGSVPHAKCCKCGDQRAMQATAPWVTTPFSYDFGAEPLPWTFTVVDDPDGKYLPHNQRRRLP